MELSFGALAGGECMKSKSVQCKLVNSPFDTNSVYTTPEQYISMKLSFVALVEWMKSKSVQCNAVELQ